MSGPPPRRFDAEPLGLEAPDQVTTAAEALEVYRVLWATLQDAVEPGPRSRTYTRRGDRRGETAPECDSCGGPRFWRPLTWPGGPPSGEIDWGDPPPGFAGPERPKAFCSACDQGGPRLTLASAPASAALDPLDVLLESEVVLADAERRLYDALGWQVLADLGYGVDRLDQIVELLPLVAVRRPAVAVDVEQRLIAGARLVRTALRDTESVVRIPARCPHCRTRGLVMWPERGEPNGDNVRGLVECTYSECVCRDVECRCHRRGWMSEDGRYPYAAFVHRWTNADWRKLERLIRVDLHRMAREERERHRRQQE